MSETSLKTPDRVREHFPDGLLNVQQAHGETTLIVQRLSLQEIMKFLQEDTDLAYDYLVDITVVDYLSMPDVVEQYQARFMLVYHLYSHKHNVRVRVKTPLAEGETVPSMIPLWKAAGWLEREVYDMFGIEFEGHPDMRRILMPDDFEGHPLRKDYPLKGRGERSSFNFDTGN